MQDSKITKTLNINMDSFSCFPTDYTVNACSGHPELESTKRKQLAGSFLFKICTEFAPTNFKKY